MFILLFLCLNKPQQDKTYVLALQYLKIDGPKLKNSDRNLLHPKSIIRLFMLAAVV